MPGENLKIEKKVTKIWKTEKTEKKHLNFGEDPRFSGQEKIEKRGKGKVAFFQFFPRNSRKQPWQAPNPNANEFQIFLKTNVLNLGGKLRKTLFFQISARKRKKTRKRNNFSLLNIVGNIALEIIGGVIFAVKKKKLPLPNPKTTQP